MKAAIFLTPFERSGKGSVDVRPVGKFLLAPAALPAQFADAIAKCFPEQAQVIPVKVYFTLRLAHLRKSADFPREPLHSRERHPV